MTPVAHAAASTTGTTNPPNPTNVPANDSVSGNEFITLLTAELKGQDPTNPMDPTQFVSQLVQFNSLEQLISINQELAPAPSSGSNTTLPAQS